MEQKVWDFDSGHLVLDFTNTAEFHASENPDEMLETYPDLVSWAQAAGLLTKKEGKKLLIENGVSTDCAQKLDLLGISSIANLVGCIKTAKYYEFGSNDIVFTVATDSMELYGSRLEELAEELGSYSREQAIGDFAACLSSQKTDHMLELSYRDKKRMHNLKYFTWVEQLGKDIKELDAQWHDETYWIKKYQSYKEWDELIREFNQKTGLVKS